MTARRLDVPFSVRVSPADAASSYPWSPRLAVHISGIDIGTVIQEKFKWVQQALFGILHNDRRLFLAGVTIWSGSFGKQKRQYLSRFRNKLALSDFEGNFPDSGLFINVDTGLHQNGHHITSPALISSSG